MTNRTRRTRQSTREQPSDEGSILLLTLVFVIVGTLLVLPIMSFAISVLRANKVLSDKTSRLEAVKAGLRVSLSDPLSLYQVCGEGGPSTPVTLAPVTLGDQTISNSCYFIDFETTQSGAELRYGVVATEVGYSPPSQLSGSVYTSIDPLSTTEWISRSSATPTTDKIWLPNLPVHSLSRRSPNGYSMPTGFPTCKVFFPGTYTDALVLDGPSYFTSGIYYFEKQVTVQAGATVVAGAGGYEGCSTDQESAFYALDAPATHDISGFGATWLFGSKGKLLVDNASGATSFQMNYRYVSEEEADSDTSAGLSIATVNGDVASDGVTGMDLQVSGLLDVPLSQVGSELPVPATQQQYVPSTLTPEPTIPDPPTAVTAQKYNGAAVVSWTAPASNGGSVITGYTATASTGPVCVTNGAATCTFTGLTNNVPVTFTVISRNAVGNSTSSSASASVTPTSTSGTLTVPFTPAAPTAAAYLGLVRVSWSAPFTIAPMTSYTVTASPGGTTCSVDMTVSPTPALECDFTTLTPATSYTFTVVARNAVGNSTASPASAVPVVAGSGTAAAPTTTPAAATPYHPQAVLEFQATATSTTTVNIPGYVSIPQGRLLVNNPTGQSVDISGGVLAAQFDVTDSRAAGPSSIQIGFVDAVVQRKLRIVSTTNAGIERSVAIVQVNQNGAYAINSWEVQ